MDSPPVASSSDEQRSFWASSVEHTLLIMREELESEVGGAFRILKVPEYERQPTTAYAPVEWRFGLHNRDENLDMSDAEAAKRAVVVLFGLDEQSKWITFCNVVVPDPKAMQKCYGLHNEVNGVLEAKIKHVLAFDALFLATYMELGTSMPSETHKLVFHMVMQSPTMKDIFYDTFQRSHMLVERDLCKIENQIPFDLIKRAINHVTELTNPRHVNIDDRGSTDSESGQELGDAYLERWINPRHVNIDDRGSTDSESGQELGDAYLERWINPRHVNIDDRGSTDSESGQELRDAYLERWMKTAVELGMSSFMDISDFFEGVKATEKLSDSHHILDAAYKVICGMDGMKRESDNEQKGYIHILSAVKLKESGIRIEGVAGPLSDMFYDEKKKCLHLPKMTIYDSTVSLVRNMARYEEYSEGNRCIFHDYVFLMLDLIETSLDLKHLVKCGVIYNECGDKGVHLWRALGEGLIVLKSSKEHNKLKGGIEKRCKLKRHRLWSEFRTLFLSRPWLTLSTVAITLVTLATLIQTYASVISSNGMKPQFKP